MTRRKLTIGIIGTGHMGTAILRGLVKTCRVSVCEKDVKKLRSLKRRFPVKSLDLAALVKKSDIIILAVKPQDFEEVLDQMRPEATQSRLIISIAAGISTHYIEKRLGGNPRVVRVMPNLPAQVAEGISAMCAGRWAKSSDLRDARGIFENIGQTLIIAEEWMDAVTAISGSGPAYLYYFMEILTQAAVGLGLQKTLARRLIYQTFKGSLALLAGKDDDVAAWRERVTSKGGTTQAALNVLTRRNMAQIVQEAVRQAQARAKELARE